MPGRLFFTFIIRGFVGDIGKSAVNRTFIEADINAKAGGSGRMGYQVENADLLVGKILGNPRQGNVARSCHRGRRGGVRCSAL